MIQIFRNREVGEGLTEQIYRECQPKLGKGCRLFAGTCNNMLFRVILRKCVLVGVQPAPSLEPNQGQRAPWWAESSKEAYS